MLLSMHIENIALIRQLDVDFEQGFTVFTGETGAGKSILIDSIGLLLGSKADATLIRTGEKEALVSGLIGQLSSQTYSALEALGITTDAEGNILLSRQITQDGKSRARINGAAVSLTVFRAVGELFVNILGQGDHQMLRSDKASLMYLDRFSDVAEELAKYKADYTTLHEISAQLRAMSMDESERIRMQEMLTYQIKDIESFALLPGEDVRLLEEEKLIKNAERIKKNARFAYLALKGSEKGSASYILDRTIASIEKLSDVVPEAHSMQSELQECIYKIDDIADRVYQLLAFHHDEDPEAALDRLEGRLAQIERLKKKYGNSVDEILAYAQNLREKLSQITLSDDRIIELKKEYAKALAQVEKDAQILHEKRLEAAKELSARVIEALRFMDMENVRFAIDVSRITSDTKEHLYQADGGDKVVFLISANKGEDLHPLSKVASGGELSRIMLALCTVISTKDDVPTMIFDEIDTGVSGKTSRKLGIKLLALSRQVQVLCVTHSAQVASLADTHLFIRKSEQNGRTETSLSQLDEPGRLGEISRIIGGIDITAAQKAAAQDMLTEKSELLKQF